MTQKKNELEKLRLENKFSSLDSSKCLPKGGQKTTFLLLLILFIKLERGSKSKAPFSRLEMLKK